MLFKSFYFKFVLLLLVLIFVDAQNFSIIKQQKNSFLSTPSQLQTSKPDYVVAYGGNAFGNGDPNLQGTKYWKSLRSQVETAANEIAHLVVQGKKVIITHGNGPQVGKLFSDDPTISLAKHVKSTQIEMGKLLEEEITKVLSSINGKAKHKITTLITHVEVDPNDPAFKEPTKPIGWFTQKVALELEKKMKEKNEFIYAKQFSFQREDGWRLVVPSPQPKRIIELEEIKKRVKANEIIIALGGGGIAVDAEGNLLEAVIDKDLASAKLAVEIDSNGFVISTGVKRVATQFDDPTPIWYSELGVKRAEQFLRKKEFPEGSMGPKIRAAILYTKKTFRDTLIAKLGKLMNALKEPRVSEIGETTIAERGGTRVNYRDETVISLDKEARPFLKLVNVKTVEELQASGLKTITEVEWVKPPFHLVESAI